MSLDGIYDKLAVGNCTTKESIDAMTDFTCKLVLSQDAVNSSGFKKIVADSMISTEGMQSYYRLQGDLDSVGNYLESNAKILDAALRNPFTHLDADEKLDIAAHEFAAMCDAHVSSEEGAKMLANLRTTLCFGKDKNLADVLRESDYFKRWELSATQTPEDYISNTFGIASNAVQKSHTENVDFQSAQADRLLSNIDDSLENESEVLLVQ